MDVARVEQRREQGAIDRRGREDHRAHLVIEQPPGRGAAGACRHLAFDVEATRRQDRQADLREAPQPHLAAQPRERRELRAVDPYRDDRRIGLVGDHAGPVEHLHQRAGDGDAALGEDDERVALLHRTHHRLGRHRVGRIDRKGAEQPQRRLDPPGARDRGMDREHRLARQECGEQQPVEPRDMVDHHHRTLAGLRHILGAVQLDPVEQFQDDAHARLDDRIGQQPA